MRSSLSAVAANAADGFRCAGRLRAVCEEAHGDRCGRLHGARAGRGGGRLAGVPVAHPVVERGQAGLLHAHHRRSCRCWRSAPGSRRGPRRSPATTPAGGRRGSRSATAVAVGRVVPADARASGTRPRASPGSRASSPRSPPSPPWPAPAASRSRSRSSSCSRARRSWARSRSGLLLGHWYLTDRGLAARPDRPRHDVDARRRADRDGRDRHERVRRGGDARRRSTRCSRPALSRRGSRSAWSCRRC